MNVSEIHTCMCLYVYILFFMRLIAIYLLKALSLNLHHGQHKPNPVLYPDNPANLSVHIVLTKPALLGR